MVFLEGLSIVRGQVRKKVGNFSKYLNMLGLFLCLGTPSVVWSETGAVATSAEEVCPLKVGSKVPPLVLKTAVGKEFQLNYQLQKKPSVVIFYRGGW